MPPLPEGTDSRSVRETLKAGLMLGAALSGLAIAWLLIANRVPSLEHVALLRNVVAASLAAAAMLVPVYRFRRRPSHLFGCTLTSWAVLTLIYAVLQIPFPRLGMRLGTFHFFVLGAVVLGMASALVWVIHLVLMLRGEAAIPARRRVR